MEIVCSRRPVGGRVGNSKSCPCGHPQESASALSREARASGPVHKSTGRVDSAGAKVGSGSSGALIVGVQIESLFTAALGLQAPWVVEKVELDTAKHRIDFEVGCTAKRLACPSCGAPDQLIHDRNRRSWRHLDFFQFEAWLHAGVPRVECTACGKTSQVLVPWAREGSGFTLLFEALALTLCQGLPVSQAARMLRVRDKQLWRRIEHYVALARAKQNMSSVRLVGIDDTSMKRGQDYITVTFDLDEKRLLFASHGRDHDAVEQFAADLVEHGGDRTAVAHACIDMSAAYAKGIGKSLPNAQISYDRYHVVALANKAMDEVRTAEWKDESQRVHDELGELDARERRSILWGMRRNPSGWSVRQAIAMHWLQRANLKTARAWRIAIAYLRMGKLTHLPTSPFVPAMPRSVG